MIRLICLSSLICVSIFGCGTRPSSTEPLSEGFRPYESTRGGEAERARALIAEAQRFAQQGRLLESIQRIVSAERLYPDEDNLLLLAAAQSKLSRSCEAPSCAQADQLCGNALDAWQSYLSRCRRCEQGPAPYAAQARAKLEALGRQCGASLRVESEPSAASLEINDLPRGTTPAELWLRSGAHRYSLQSGELTSMGEVSLERGEQRRLQLRLRAPQEQMSVDVLAKLQCAATQRGGQCAGQLSAGGFQLELKSSGRSYFYLLSESDSNLSLVFPSDSGDNELQPNESMRFPPQGALELERGTSEERLYLIFSVRRLSVLTNPGELDEGIAVKVRRLFEHSSFQLNSAHPDQLRAFGREGFVVISWTLRAAPVARYLPRFEGTEPSGT